ncbi:MAG: hypothetical protein A3G24_22965 [Betaproteobacteria bacterium RIFCSPLOWO2_12_FULL_62_13]|nr:MAG: hypothetical protein A3G24_22965 [Betaproteobacteria bacterium RIFCSPLOWO2_12_FULL_62_13]
MNFDTAADRDHQARSALWEAIRHAAGRIVHSSSVIVPTLGGEHISVQDVQRPPEVRTWQLLEALSLLSILVKATAITAPRIVLFRLRVGSRAMFEAMNRAISQAQLKPIIDPQFEFGDARAAYDYLASRARFGKIIMRVA